MTKDELKLALKHATRDERHLSNAETRYWCDQYKLLATQAIEALAQPEQEPVAWRETHSKVIKALAAIVTVHTPDKLFDLDAIPRDPVMHLVQQIKAAIDGYKPPQRKPLTGGERREIAYRWRDGNGTASEIIDMVEAAHGIKE